MDVKQWTVVGALIAATIPLFFSVFAVFSSQTRVRDERDFFLQSASVDIDSFLKASIGYSLQVAAISLFFYWAITYGAWSLLVAFAWGVGYLLVAWAAKRGVFDRFIAANSSGNQNGTVLTIHGFVSTRIVSSPGWTRASVSIVALASVIGLGGTLITEIDYTTKLLFQSIEFEAASERVQLYETAVHLTILFFVTFYVLWGGFRAVVFTERFQVPAAYVSFFIFGIGILYFASHSATSSKSIILCAAILLVGVLSARISLLRNLRKRTLEADWAAYLTFIPLIVLAVLAVVFSDSQWSLPAREVWLPSGKSWLGPGILASFALFVTNAVWQFIDISSLQRLQSVGNEWEAPGGRDEVVRALRVVGVEAALGWVLIIIVGLGLRALGILDSAKIGSFLVSQGGLSYFLVPVFTFAISVFMISTISGFVSAISYISYYDLVRFGGRNGGETKTASLKRARIVTAVSIIFLYIGYLILRQGTGDIAPTLYAIYAFQIAILPAVFSSLDFGNSRFFSFLRRGLWPLPIIGSTATGLFFAAFTAIDTDTLKKYLPEDAVTVIPPLAVILTSSLAYIVLTAVGRVLRR